MVNLAVFGRLRVSLEVTVLDMTNGRNVWYEEISATALKTVDEWKWSSLVWVTRRRAGGLRKSAIVREQKMARMRKLLLVGRFAYLNHPSSAW
jgi:hypothetical protein